MKLFRKFSRTHTATNLKEIRKQNRISYVALCAICVKRAENKWLAKDETQEYLKGAGPNAIASAYTQIRKEALDWAYFIYTLR